MEEVYQKYKDKYDDFKNYCQKEEQKKEQKKREDEEKKKKEEDKKQAEIEQEKKEEEKKKNDTFMTINEQYKVDYIKKTTVPSNVTRREIPPIPQRKTKPAFESAEITTTYNEIIKNYTKFETEYVTNLSKYEDDLEFFKSTVVNFIKFAIVFENTHKKPRSVTDYSELAINRELEVMLLFNEKYNVKYEVFNFPEKFFATFFNTYRQLNKKKIIDVEQLNKDLLEVQEPPNQIMEKFKKLPSRPLDRINFNFKQYKNTLPLSIQPCSFGDKVIYLYHNKYDALNKRINALKNKYQKLLRDELFFDKTLIAFDLNMDGNLVKIKSAWNNHVYAIMKKKNEYNKTLSDLITVFQKQKNVGLHQFLSSLQTKLENDEHKAFFYSSKICDMKKTLLETLILKLNIDQENIKNLELEFIDEINTILPTIEENIDQYNYFLNIILNEFEKILIIKTKYELLIRKEEYFFVLDNFFYKVEDRDSLKKVKKQITEESTVSKMLNIVKTTIGDNVPDDIFKYFKNVMIEHINKVSTNKNSKLINKLSNIYAKLPHYPSWYDNYEELYELFFKIQNELNEKQEFTINLTEIKKLSLPEKFKKFINNLRIFVNFKLVNECIKLSVNQNIQIKILNVMLETVSNFNIKNYETFCRNILTLFYKISTLVLICERKVLKDDIIQYKLTQMIEKLNKLDSNEDIDKQVSYYLILCSYLEMIKDCKWKVVIDNFNKEKTKYYDIYLEQIQTDALELIKYELNESYKLDFQNKLKKPL
jgi:hypothetical protein